MADDILLFLLFRENKARHLMQMIHMKFQALCSLKNKNK